MCRTHFLFFFIVREKSQISKQSKRLKKQDRYPLKAASFSTVPISASYSFWLLRYFGTNFLIVRGSLFSKILQLRAVALGVKHIYKIFLYHCDQTQQNRQTPYFECCGCLCIGICIPLIYIRPSFYGGKHLEDPSVEVT